MAEWLILLLLVPAIVVPVVLLAGFAGCEFLPCPAAVVDSAVGQDVSTITVTWEPPSDLSNVRTFVFVRTNLSDNTTFSFFVATATPTFDDTGHFRGDHGLEPATLYQYVLRIVCSNVIHTSDPVTGTTLGFETTFDETGAFSADSTGWEGFTLVQRIEAAALTPISRTRVAQVRITLYASSMGDASIDRIFISAPAPPSATNPNPNPYDSAPDLTAVPLPNTPLVIPANTFVTLPVTLHGRGVDYVVQPQSQPLLIAVDFTAPPTASAVREAVNVPAGRAVAYWHQGAPEAMRQMRSAGYQPGPAGARAVYLVGKVEIG